ncbi:MAG TPA: serine/threonine-protein kinase [Phycisphaerales bacterium]|nr:serine/threonine-protein kinase [Phycisphaerales bacterium]
MNGPVSFYKAGDTLEGMRVLQELGQGAASTVYLAQDPKTKQIWAVKHVHRSTEKDERFLDQACLEYDAASHFDHPAIRKIPKIHKVRTKLFTQLTDVFLVMEFTDGVSMEKKRPKTYAEALEIFLEVARAMRHMHERGWVHADMKPNNVMIAPGPIVKIIDLGQSCKVGTVKTRIQGTPDYIAPEQVMRKPITPLTDVYNLGATMYWVLTGKNVPTPLNSSNENSLIDKVDPSLLPKPQAPCEIDPRCPQKLNDLILQSVAIDPEDRPDAMSVVIDRLELVLGQLRARKTDDDLTLLDPAASGVRAAAKLDQRSAGSTSVMGVRINPSEQAG